jgi:hypothetical protein
MSETTRNEEDIDNQIYRVGLTFATVTNAGDTVDIDVVYIDGKPWFCLEDVIKATTGEVGKKLWFDEEIQSYIKTIRLAAPSFSSILASVIPLQGLRRFGVKWRRSSSIVWLITDFNAAAGLSRNKGEDALAKQQTADAKEWLKNQKKFEEDYHDTDDGWQSDDGWQWDDYTKKGLLILIAKKLSRILEILEEK